MKYVTLEKQIVMADVGRFVKLGMNMVLATTYLEFQTVNPLVATIHNSLEADRLCSWADSTINEPPNLVKRCTLSVYCIGK